MFQKTSIKYIWKSWKISIRQQWKKIEEKGEKEGKREEEENKEKGDEKQKKKEWNWKSRVGQKINKIKTYWMRLMPEKDKMEEIISELKNVLDETFQNNVRQIEKLK